MAVAATGLAAGLAVLIVGPTAAPAAADTVTPVGSCPAGDASAELDGKLVSVGVAAPAGRQIVAYCVSGRGVAGPEVHTLSNPTSSTTVRHSTGKGIITYSVTYAAAPEPAAPAPAPTPDEPAASTAPSAQPSVSTEPAPSAAASAVAASAAPAPAASESPSPSASPSETAGAVVGQGPAEEEDDVRWGRVIRGGIVAVLVVGAGVGALVRYLRGRAAAGESGARTLGAEPAVGYAVPVPAGSFVQAHLDAPTAAMPTVPAPTGVRMPAPAAPGLVPAAAGPVPPRHSAAVPLPPAPTVAAPPFPAPPAPVPAPPVPTQPGPTQTRPGGGYVQYPGFPPPEGTRPR
ncbi:hypothetical protein [Antribacter gilvus]|uniref:hypothetical protein n=1 Tax=Antribacter gilvus TaxID=2304675 RepID=UPI0013DF8E28|nr:hypothetical protein [Antribacter gilvus]